MNNTEYSTNNASALRRSVDADQPASQASALQAGALARVSLTVTDGADVFSWDAPVWFCDPWPHPFGLAGLEGFLHHFVVTIRSYDGYLDIEPNP